MIDFNNAPPQSPPSGLDSLRLPLLKQRLHSQAESFVREFLPAAVIRNGEARVGNLQGSPGESLQITLTGEMCGVWVDHADANVKGGDLISLYAALEGLDQRQDFPKILDDLEAWAGITRNPKPRSAKQVAREAKKTEPNPHKEPLAPPNGRWHYKDENSNIIATVYRHPVGEDDKTYRPWDAKRGKAAMPEVRPLYNLPALKGATMVILVEGEKSAQALIDLGYVATTAMGGANTKDDKTDWTPLQGKEVILWPDADQAGQIWLQHVGRTLHGIASQCRTVAPPEGVPEGWDAADAKEDGTNIAGLLNAALQAKRQPRFKILTLDELDEQPEPEWLIDSYLTTNGLCLLYGASGSFKSFIALDIGLTIAHGLPWCDRTTKQQAVVYIAAEGGFGLNKRIRAWHKSHALERAKNFFVLPSAVNLLDPKADVADLIEDIRDALGGLILGMVVIDTLARSFVGGDENQAKDMNAFIANCDRIREAFQCLTMPIHHTGKDVEKGARGSSSLRAAVDTEIWAKRIGTSNRVILSCTKQKDAEEADKIYMETVPVEIVSRDGEILKSAVVKAITSPVKKDYLGPTEKLILGVLGSGETGFKYAAIVTKTNKSESSVAASLKSLTKAGMVEKRGDLYFSIGVLLEEEADEF
jgi:putative DNA primase/helicase